MLEVPPGVTPLACEALSIGDPFHAVQAVKHLNSVVYDGRRVAGELLKRASGGRPTTDHFSENALQQTKNVAVFERPTTDTSHRLLERPLRGCQRSQRGNRPGPSVLSNGKRRYGSFIAFSSFLSNSTPKWRRSGVP